MEDKEKNKENVYVPEIRLPFEPAKIRIDSQVTTIDNLIKRMKHDEINLTPDFQRSDNIWTTKARSRLIESLLIRIPIPSFYFDATNEDKWIVIDGLQRLTTLQQFVIKNELALKDLEYLTELNGKYYSNLSRKFQRRIEETQVTVVLVKMGTPANVKYNIFKRINTGGLPLTPQEIRHALNQGTATKFLMELANYKLFKEVSRKDNRRMEISELILRILAYQVFSLEKALEFSYDNLLNEALRELNKLSMEELRAKGKVIISSLKAAYRIFDKYVFRKQYEEHGRRNPFNKPLYETWMVNLSKFNKEQLNKLIEHKKYVNKRFINLMNNSQFDASVSSGKPHARYRRIVEIEKLIREVLK